MALRVKHAQAGYVDGKGRFHPTGKKVKIGKKNPLPLHWTPAKVMQDAKGQIKVLLTGKENPVRYKVYFRNTGEGAGYFDTKAEAVKYAKELRQRGVNVGIKGRSTESPRKHMRL